MSDRIVGAASPHACLAIGTTVAPGLVDSLFFTSDGPGRGPDCNPFGETRRRVSSSGWRSASTHPTAAHHCEPWTSHCEPGTSNGALNGMRDQLPFQSLRS